MMQVRPSKDQKKKKKREGRIHCHLLSSQPGRCLAVACADETQAQRRQAIYPGFPSQHLACLGLEPLHCRVQHSCGSFSTLPFPLFCLFVCLFLSEACGGFQARGLELRPFLSFSAMHAHNGYHSAPTSIPQGVSDSPHPHPLWAEWVGQAPPPPQLPLHCQLAGSEAHRFILFYFFAF